MENKLIENSIKAHKIYLNGLIAEDTALSSMFNNFLTFNSLFALAFVGALQGGIDKYWQDILLIGIPLVSIILNILWITLDLEQCFHLFSISVLWKISKKSFVMKASILKNLVLNISIILKREENSGRIIKKVYSHGLVQSGGQTRSFVSIYLY